MHFVFLFWSRQSSKSMDFRLTLPSIYLTWFPLSKMSELGKKWRLRCERGRFLGRENILMRLFCWVFLSPFINKKWMFVSFSQLIHHWFWFCKKVLAWKNYLDWMAMCLVKIINSKYGFKEVSENGCPKKWLKNIFFTKILFHPTNLVAKGS